MTARPSNVAYTLDKWAWRARDWQRGLESANASLNDAIRRGATESEVQNLVVHRDRCERGLDLARSKLEEWRAKYVQAKVAAVVPEPDEPPVLIGVRLRNG